MKKSETTRRRTIDSLQAYPPPLYDGVNLNWLILLSVGVLEEKGVDLSFENIVIAAFRLFPKKFSLLGYPEHPDANRIRAAIVLRCAYKNRQWLLGTISQGFAFTERGRQELELAKRALQKDYLPIKKTFSKTRRFEKLLGEVRASPAYAKYSKRECDRISEAECCHVLQGTLDSDRRVLLDNLTKLREMATGLEQKDLVEFMEWLPADLDDVLSFVSILGTTAGWERIQEEAGAQKKKLDFVADNPARARGKPPPARRMRRRRRRLTLSI